MKANTDLEDAIIAHARRVGSTGFSVVDVPFRCTPRQAYSVCQRLVLRGLLHKGKSGHRTLRMFSTAQWAADYSRTRRRIGTEGRTGEKVQRRTAGWTADTPVIFPVDAAGRPLYKFTVCPSRCDPQVAQMRNLIRWNSDAAINRL